MDPIIQELFPGRDPQSVTVEEILEKTSLTTPQDDVQAESAVDMPAIDKLLIDSKRSAEDELLLKDFLALLPKMLPYLASIAGEQITPATKLWKLPLLALLPILENLSQGQAGDLSPQWDYLEDIASSLRGSDIEHLPEQHQQALLEDEIARLEQSIASQSIARAPPGIPGSTGEGGSAGAATTTGVDVTMLDRAGEENATAAPGIQEDTPVALPSSTLRVSSSRDSSCTADVNNRDTAIEESGTASKAPPGLVASANQQTNADDIMQEANDETPTWWVKKKPELPESVALRSVLSEMVAYVATVYNCNDKMMEVINTIAHPPVPTDPEKADDLKVTDWFYKTKTNDDIIALTCDCDAHDPVKSYRKSVQRELAHIHQDEVHKDAILEAIAEEKKERAELAGEQRSPGDEEAQALVPGKICVACTVRADKEDKPCSLLIDDSNTDWKCYQCKGAIRGCRVLCDSCQSTFNDDPLSLPMMCEGCDVRVEDPHTWVASLSFDFGEDGSVQAFYDERVMGLLGVLHGDDDEAKKDVIVELQRMHTTLLQEFKITPIGHLKDAAALIAKDIEPHIAEGEFPEGAVDDEEHDLGEELDEKMDEELGGDGDGMSPAHAAASFSSRRIAKPKSIRGQLLTNTTSDTPAPSASAYDDAEKDGMDIDEAL